MLRSVPHLHLILEIVRAIVFALFACLALWNAFGHVWRVSNRQRRKRATALIGYVCAASMVVGITRVEAWPFSAWSLIHTLRSPLIRSWEIEGTDAAGRNYLVDPRVLQPLSPEEFGSWMFRQWPRLSPEARDEVMQFLLARAESGRVAFLRGEFPSNDIYVGVASAPFHFRQRRLWQSGADVPSTAFTKVTIWRLDWNIEERARTNTPPVKTAIASSSE